MMRLSSLFAIPHLETMRELLLSFFLLEILLISNEIFAGDVPKNIVWCTTSMEEDAKCNQFSIAVDKDVEKLGADYRRIVCKRGTNKEECMALLDQEMADLTMLDAGEIFIGGRHHSLVPIMQETYSNGERYYYSVAVVKRGSLPEVRSIKDLKGKSACFAGVGSLAGWIIPIYTLMKQGGMEIHDCNNHVKSAIQYFGPSCAINSLIDSYNPIGDNSDKLCRLCAGEAVGTRCTPKDPYYGFEGAFKCLKEKGEITFLKHSTISEIISKRQEFGDVKMEDYELLCTDGTRRTVNEFRNCNWGRSPSHAIVTTSANTPEERRFYQRFLKKVVDLYGKGKNTNKGGFSNSAHANNEFVDISLNDTNYEQNFRLFESSPRYGLKHDLLFQDSTIDMRALEEVEQTYTGYLKESLSVILGLRDCPVDKMTLCVTSELEMEKCVKMKSALKAQLLKPEMFCHRGHSQINCMQAVKNNIADVAVFDAGDIYTAGYKYDLIPFLSEVYNLGKPEYYAVAVAKEDDPTTDLTYLRGKYTCHPGVDFGAGWIVPLALLISNGWIRNYKCNSIKTASEFFTKSCVPGVLNLEYDKENLAYNLCDLCHGTSYKYCRRDANEDYFGYTGAFRCLVEGGGQVAFLRHTTVLENTDGKRREIWARNVLSGDFELLCNDGKRAEVKDYKRCSLGKVKANAIVTRGGNLYNETEIHAFSNLFLYAQQFYGSKISDEFSFSMFSSPSPYNDLIFQDSTTKLQLIPTEEMNYKDYLGKNFLRAKRIIDCL